MAGIDAAALGFRQGVDYLMKLLSLMQLPRRIVERRPMLSDVEAAYTAGILDGEGSISLTRNRKDRWPSPQVSVASNDRELMVWLSEHFGGSITTKKPRRSTHSISYDWKLTDRQALQFLALVRPYLVIGRKIKRADLLLNAYLNSTPRNGRYTAEQLECKKKLIERFSSLP
jgi:hypothetical protein